MAETKEVKKEVTPTPVKEETVAKAEYDKVVEEYNKLATAFNKLLREFNDLHLKTLFVEEPKQ